MKNNVYGLALGYRTKHYKYVYNGREYYRGDMVVPNDPLLNKIYNGCVFVIDNMYTKEGLVSLEVMREVNGNFVNFDLHFASQSTKYTLAIDQIKPYLNMKEKLDVLLNDD